MSGRHGDVILGMWSCCGRVDPEARGCESVSSQDAAVRVHERSLHKCMQCGLMFNVRAGCGGAGGRGG